MPVNLPWIYCKKPHSSIADQQTCICTLNYKAKMRKNLYKIAEIFFDFYWLIFIDLIIDDLNH